MKLNKVVMVGLAAFALTLGACKKAEDPGQPVSRVSVTKPDSVLVVGDVVDLDDYINVEGGKGPKVYTATAARGSENLVEFGTGKDAHKFTILEEGAIKINVVAENLETKKTATFAVDAYSKIKAAFVSATDGIAYSYAFAQFEEDASGAEKFVGYYYHNEEYYYGRILNKGSWKIDEGLIRYEQTGNTYSFTTDGDFECSGYKILQRESDISRYSTNQLWFITAGDVTTKQDANGVEYLEISGDDNSTDGCPYSAPIYSSLASEVGFKFFNDYPEYIGQYYNIDIKVTSIDIYPNEDADGKITSLDFYMMTSEEGATPEVWGAYRLLPPEQSIVPFLEEERKTGAHEPAAIDPVEFGEALDAIAVAGNYTVNYLQWWSSGKDGQDVVDLSEDTADQKNVVYSWLENCYERDVQVDGEGRRGQMYTINDDWEAVDLVYDGGWAKYSSDPETYISFGQDYDSATGTYGPVTSETIEKATFDKVDAAYTLTALTSDSAAYVTDITGKEEGGNFISYSFANSQNTMDDLLATFFQQASVAGYTAHRFFTEAFSSGSAYDFLTGTITIFDDGDITLKAGFCWTTGAWYNVEITITKIGSTTLDLTGVPAPVAD